MLQSKQDHKNKPSETQQMGREEPSNTYFRPTLQSQGKWQQITLQLGSAGFEN